MALESVNRPMLYHTTPRPPHSFKAETVQCFIEGMLPVLTASVMRDAASVNSGEDSDLESERRVSLLKKNVERVILDEFYKTISGGSDLLEP